MANPNSFDYWANGTIPTGLAGVPSGGTMDYWCGSRLLRLIGGGVAGLPGLAARIYTYFTG